VEGHAGKGFRVSRAKAHHGLLMGAGVGGGGGLLDSYTTDLWGAYGLELLRGNYSGSAIRVRRSSDDTEQDIGFSSGILDTASLATFVGANDGFIVTWYDQSGGGNHLSQATASQQPKIVDAGSYMGEICTDGVNDFLATTNSSGTPTAFSLYIAGRCRTGGPGASEVLLEHSSSGAAIVYNRGTSYTDDCIGVVASASSCLNHHDETAVNDGTVYAAVVDRSQSSIATECAYYLNGAAQASIGSAGSQVSGSYSAGTWCMGQDTAASATNISKLAYQAIFIYETAHSSGTVASISALPTMSKPVDGLSSYTSNLWGAWGLRRLLSGYGTGALIRVRRSNDNAEQDIGSDSTTKLLDTAALASFVGSNSAFVTTIYDQGGNSRHWVQATASKQPRIVNAGAILPKLSFDGSDDSMSIGSNSGTPSAFTIMVKANVEQTGNSVLLEHSSDFNSNDAVVFAYDTRSCYQAIRDNSPGGYSQSYFPATWCGNVIMMVANRAGGSNDAQHQLYAGGNSLTKTSGSPIATLPDGNFGAHPWFLGARNNTSNFLQFDLESLAIWETAQSAINIERISRGTG
jgi:hypothetical protein